jgi:hypothetical protein
MILAAYATKPEHVRQSIVNDGCVDRVGGNLGQPLSIA